MKFLFFFLLLFPVSGFSQSASAYLDSVQYHRFKVDEEFRDTSSSPLTAKDREVFIGLDYFDVDTNFRVRATFVKYPRQKSFLMKTSTDRTPKYHRFGYVEFVLKGTKFQLQVYQNKEVSSRPGMEDYLFIPFTDLTNGTESYGGGRYLDFRIPVSDSVIIDFNFAYNPYCAYSTGYSCPVPPAENFLNTRIEAGEKNFGDR